MGPLRCVCIRPWTDADQEADQDIKQGSLPIDAADETKGVTAEVAEAGDEDDTKISWETDTPAPSDAMIAVPEAESVTRADDLLTEGGLVMSQVYGGARKKTRRVELDANTGVLSWKVEFFLGTRVERVNLQEANMMCFNNRVKIGIRGKHDSFVFEAQDEKEAAAICDCLVMHAKMSKQEAGAPKGEVEQKA